jgi:hypothetical protein
VVPQEATLSELVNWDKLGSGFVARNLQNPWVCIDFQDRRVRLTHYVLRASNLGDESFLRSWALEGSNDGEEWVKLDDRQNDASLTSNELIALFQVRQELEVQKIRLRQTRPNSRNQFVLALKSIEFFGTLKSRIY